MESSGKLSYIFRKYFLVRVLLLLFFVAFVFFIIYLVSHKTESVPVIESLVPPVGAPGDVVQIYGKNFGDERDMSYVSFSGLKLTSSSYLSWSDTVIKVVLPGNVQDGLVVVGTKDAQSNPALFANEIDIPVLAPSVHNVIKPVISEVSVAKASIGDLIVITGSNFGENRNNSKVLFTIDYNKKIKDSEYVNKRLVTENFVEVSDLENGYEYWSNTEIHVRVPDGACSGVIVVENERDKSEPFDFEVSDSAISKEYISKKIFIVQYNADVKDIDTNDVSTITMRCPIPCKMPSQSNVDITEISPVPLFQNYQGCNIQQITKYKNGVSKNTFSQTFVLPVYEIRTTVNPDKTGSMKNLNQTFYTNTTRKDAIVPADEEEVIKLYKKIVDKEKNSYKRAKLIYEYMCKEFKILDKNRRNDADPLELISREKGDAYDFAVIYAALLRTAGIPCLVDCGILVEQDLKSRVHWWCEFFIPGCGWIPVDPALGAGLEYKKWPEKIDEKTYYFGNLDSHHVTFSRGYNEMKPFAPDNKIVQYPKSFALQSIWEEVSASTNKYSSYWSVPYISGIY